MATLACRRLRGILTRHVDQFEPVQHEVHARHALQTDRRAALAVLRDVRLDNAAQLRPRNNLLHRRQDGFAPDRLAVPLVLRDVRGGHGEGLLLHAGINAGGVQEGDLINVALDGSSIDLFDGALQIAIELFVTRCKSEVIDQCAGEAGN